MLRTITHYEEVLGLDLGYSEEVYGDRLLHLTPFVHDPVFFVRNPSKMKNRMAPDWTIVSLIREEWLEPIDFGLCRPSISAMYLDFCKWSNFETKREWTHSMALAVSVVQEWFGPALSNGVELVGFEEACRRLDPLSSPGFPWNKKYRTRREFLASADVEAALLWWVQSGECIWKVSPKEEIRATSKLEADSIRTFMAGLVEENLLTLIVLGGFNDALCENWRLIPFTVGMSTKHAGWDCRIRRWPSRHSICRDKDGHKMEGSIESWLYDVLFDIVSPYVDDFEVVVLATVPVGTRRSLFRLLCDRWKESPCIFSDGLGCWKWGNNPSGGAWTIWVNSFCMAYFRAWHLLDCGFKVEDLVGAGRLFSFDFHGDDSVDGTTQEYELFTRVDHFNGWAASKGLLIRLKNEQTSDVSGVEYLSQRTVLRDGVYLPMHKEPAKLLASAGLKPHIDVPACGCVASAGCPGWNVRSYHLARLASICVELWPVQEVYRKAAAVYFRYRELYNVQLVNDKHWLDAQKMFLSEKTLERLWMLPEGLSAQATPRHDMTTGQWAFVGLNH